LLGLGALGFAELASFFIDLFHEVAAGKHAQHALPIVRARQLGLDSQGALQHLHAPGKRLQGELIHHFASWNTLKLITSF
jgi:hypothetical protein